MLTSQEILLKVLRLNKGLIFFLGIVILTGTAVYAETAETLAVLERGPLLKTGVPFIGPNSLPYYYGEYRLGESKKVEVFSASDLVPLTGWKSFSCGQTALLEVPSVSGRVFFFQAEENLFVFFRFPISEESPCVFISRFIIKYRYFLGLSRMGGYTTFPAVLELNN